MLRTSLPAVPQGSPCPALGQQAGAQLPAEEQAEASMTLDLETAWPREGRRAQLEGGVLVTGLRKLKSESAGDGGQKGMG